MISAEDAIAAIHKRFGAHAGHRALHAKGTLCTGHFVATPEAAALTTAAHMQGSEAPVLARVSNGGGNPKVPDYEPDVRGLAVSFELPDGSRTDIVSQSIPSFPFSDVESFIGLIDASRREPGSLIRFPLFLLRHPRVMLSLPENTKALKLPRSYSAIPYIAVHAFRWTGADGGSRWVRYRWQPVEPQPPLGRGEARELGRDYLREEIAERVAAQGARFDLQLEIAGEGDNPHNPASQWRSAERVNAGALTLTAITEAGDANVFDPMKLTDGIEPSDDPILRFRPLAYSESYALRTS